MNCPRCDVPLFAPPPPVCPSCGAATTPSPPMAAPTRTVKCVECHHPNVIAVDLVDLSCEQCATPAHRALCTGCDEYTWIWGRPRPGSGWTCPRCTTRNTVTWGAGSLSTPVTDDGVFCTACGAHNREISQFCFSCGRPLSDEHADEVGQVPLPVPVVAASPSQWPPAPPVTAESTTDWGAPAKRLWTNCRGLPRGLQIAAAVFIGLLLIGSVQNAVQHRETHLASGTRSPTSEVTEYIPPTAEVVATTTEPTDR